MGETNDTTANIYRGTKNMSQKSLGMPRHCLEHWFYVSKTLKDSNLGQIDEHRLD